VLPTWVDSLGQHFVGSLVRWPEGGLNNGLILWRFYFTGGDIDYEQLRARKAEFEGLEEYHLDMWQS